MEKLIIFLVIVGFSAIRGLIKTANEKAEKERRLAERGDPNRKQKVQGEIEAFLSEVGGGGGDGGRPRRVAGQSERTTKRRGQRNQQAEAQRQQGRRDQEEQQRQRDIQRRRRQQKQRREAEAKQASAPTQRRVGSGISEHVDQYISQHVAEHLDHDVEEYVEATIVDSVEDHLGSRRTEMPRHTTTTSRKPSDAAKAVVALLKDPAGVRNAILINEILSRPRVLQRD